MCFKYFLFSSILFSLVCCSKQPQTKQIVIYGVVQAGKVSGANIAAYSVENGNRGKLIGETKSNESGNYSLSLPSGTGPIEVVASQGSFKDESTGLIISLSSSDEITAIVDSGTKDQATPITPFTTLVHDRVLVQLKQGNVTQDQFSTSKNAAETEVAQLFGVEPNLITTLPSDPESPGNPNDPEAKSAYLLTLFSQMTKDLGLGPDNSVHPASVLREISRDFSNDGNLNGQDMGTPISEATSKLSENWTQSLIQSAENLQTNPKTSSFSEFNKDSILTQDHTNYPEDRMSETSSLAQVQVTICHHPTSSTSNYVTITVAQSALSAHQAHGDSIGRCIQWSPISVLNAPSARLFHTAVWTGTKMIIWGGHNGTAGLDSGGIYDPATDSWTAISTTNAPSGRSQHTAVWTGSRMIVWGGADSHSYFNDGGIFDPATNSWTSLSTINSPQGKAEHTAVWTGKKNDRLGRAYVCILGQAE